LEINLTPNSEDKSDLYRTKLSIPSEIPVTTTLDKLPPVTNARQRRTLHSIRRRRLRGSMTLRSSIRGSNSVTPQRSQSSRPTSNMSVRHPMVTDDRWRRTLRKRRRQRVLQMKLDGNIVSRSLRPISDHTYNEIRPGNHRTRAMHQTSPVGGVLERAMQFNGALRDRVFSWYRGANPHARQQQSTTLKMLSNSENEQSDDKVTHS
jgi:hypothetical protein